MCIDSVTGCLRMIINKEEAENPIKSRHKFKTINMKKYSKPQIVAKNLPSGSYAAGCPAKDRGSACFILHDQDSGCENCDRAK